MSDDSAVIREFLVSIGVTFNRRSENQLNQGLARTKNSALGFAKSLGLMAAAVTALVVKASSDMDNLYWTSKRLKSSVGEIKAYEYGISQLGGSAQGARSALEGIAKFARSTPGGKGFLASLGVAPGDMNDAVKTANDLGKAFSKMPFYRAQAYASQFGIDDETLMAMIRDPGAFEKKYSKAAADMGVDLDDAAKKSNHFMTAMRDLTSQSGLVAGGLLDDGLTALQPKLDDFMDWIKDARQGTGGELAHDVHDLATDIGDMVNAVGQNKIWQGFWEDFGIGLHFITDQSLKRLDKVVKGIAALARGDWQSASMYFNQASGALDDGGGGSSSGGGQSQGAYSDNMVSGFADGDGGAAAATPKGGAGTSVIARARQAYQYFLSQGHSPAQAAGMVAGLYSESGLDPTRPNMQGSGAYGIGQWLSKDRLADFRRVIGRDLVGSSYEQQLAFVEHEYRNSQAGALAGAGFNRAKTAQDALSAHIYGFERPGAAGGASDMKGGSKFLQNNDFGQNAAVVPSGYSGNGAVSMTQKTEIIVQGHDLAQQVSDRQTRVNDTAFRKLRSVVA